MKMVADLCYISTIEPSTTDSAPKDEYWLNAMQEELLQFRRNNVWTLVSKPEGVNVIGIKWVFKNKTDEVGCVTKNKARLVAQGYTQVEGIYFDETFAPVAQLEAIRLLLGISCIQKLKLYQMDVKTPRAWYERLTVYLRDKGYSRGEIDKTLFIHRKSDQLLVAQIYVDDIIFGGFPQDLVNTFINIMQLEFEMSMWTPAATHVKLTKDTDGAEVDHKLYRSIVGNLLYLTASLPDIAYAVGICARYQADPHISDLEVVKRILKYVHGTSDFGMMYSYDTTPTLVGYCDADWAGLADDRKSTFGGCFFLGKNLISWLSKKQNCVSLSTAEAEYIAAGSGCTQLIWMKNMLHEYGFDQNTMTLYCDNMSTIDISKNPIQHSRTKHI
ncbi:hypothetical protein IC582_007589 [Cucumis melo]